MSDKRVLLLLEGTYPYVRGGVSSWVHQMIVGLPEYRFDIVFVGGSRAHYGKLQYELPANVGDLRIWYLEDAWLTRKGARCPGNEVHFAESDRYHDVLRAAPADCSAEISGLLALVTGSPAAISHDDFLFSYAAWRSIVSSYEKYCTDPNFLNYFWTVRSMHAPVFLLAEIAREVEPPQIIHSVSTGYAGLLGAMLKTRHPESSFLLSEHGIYTKERKIDLSQADWIQDPRSDLDVGLTEDASYIRKLWIDFYQQVGLMTYESADPIISLYEGNRERQVTDGAQRAKTLVIPNGISLERYSDAMSQRDEKPPKVVGFIGRVVPIKDVKTFVRAMRTIVSAVPEAEAWIIGPTEEDEDYANECESLVQGLGLEGKVKFLGFQNVPEMMPQLGLMVLTSISEAQPLVILEAYAAGVPCVATDVGSCRELIEGGSAEGDRELGHAGAVTAIANPGETAQACIELMTDDEKWRQAQTAGYERVTRFYTEELMFERYANLYEAALESAPDHSAETAADTG